MRTNSDITGPPGLVRLRTTDLEPVLPLKVCLNIDVVLLIISSETRISHGASVVQAISEIISI